MAGSTDAWRGGPAGPACGTRPL